jgi:hypothetical protein
MEKLCLQRKQVRQYRVAALNAARVGHHGPLDCGSTRSAGQTPYSPSIRARERVRDCPTYAARHAGDDGERIPEIHRTLLSFVCVTDFGGISWAGSQPVQVWRRTDGFVPLIAAVLLQIEDRDAFVVGRSLQDIRMA